MPVRARLNSYQTVVAAVLLAQLFLVRWMVACNPGLSNAAATPMKSAPVVQTVQSYLNRTFLTKHTTTQFDSRGGDLIVVCASSHAGVTMVPSDSFNNIWTSAAGPTSTTGALELRTQVWYAKRPTVGAGHTITLNLSSPQSLVISVVVIKGSNSSAPIDAISTIGDDGGSQTVHVASPSLTTTSDNDLLIGFAKSSVSEIWTPGAGYVAQGAASSDYLDAQAGWAAKRGEYNAPFYIGTFATWQAVVVAVRPSVRGTAHGQARP